MTSYTISSEKRATKECARQKIQAEKTGRTGLPKAGVVAEDAGILVL